MKIGSSLLASLAVMGLVCGAPVLRAQTVEGDAAILDQAFGEIKNGNPQKAIDLVAPLIARDADAIARDKRRTYCGMSTTETLLYLTQAAATKQGAVALNGAVCDRIFVKAFALVDLDRVADAQAIFRHLLDLAPEHSQYWSELANTYRLQKAWDASLDAYRRAESAAGLAQKSDVANRTCAALRGEGYALVELGRWDEAERAYRTCLKAVPRDAKSLGELEYIRQNRPKT